MQEHSMTYGEDGGLKPTLRSDLIMERVSKDALFVAPNNAAFREHRGADLAHRLLAEEFARHVIPFQRAWRRKKNLLRVRT